MTHADIIARLTAATGPDRELDRSIGLALGLLHLDQDGRLYRIDPDDGGWVYGGLSDDILIRHYTASLDDTVRLIERVLPGWEWSTGNRDSLGNAWGKVRVGPLNSIQDSAPTPPLALLLALFQVLEMRDRHHG